MNNQNDKKYYRSVIHYMNLSTGESIYVRSKSTYQQPGPAKAWGTNHKRSFYYAQARYDSTTKSYVKRQDDERFPYVERWVEEAIGWQRI